MGIKTEVQAMADAIAKNLKVAKDGKAEITGHPYFDNLPKDLTKEVVEQVQGYNTTFIAGSGLAAGQAAIAAMSSNKKLDEVEVSFDMAGKDGVTHSVQRSRTSRNPQSGDEIVKLGVMTTSYDVRGGSQKVGQLGAVRTMIGELAVEKLKA